MSLMVITIKKAAFRLSKGGFFMPNYYPQLPEIQVLDRVVANGAKAKRQHGVKQHEGRIVRCQTYDYCG